MSENTDINLQTERPQLKQEEAKKSKKSLGTLHGETCDYELISELGRGSYGDVFKAKCLYKTDSAGETEVEYCAIKRYKTSQHPESYGIAATTLRELQVLQTLYHSNVIKIKDILLQKAEGFTEKKYKDVYAVFNLCDTDLRRHIYKLEGVRKRQQTAAKNIKVERPFYPYKTSDYVEHVKDIVFQSLMGLAHCHSRRVIHRDLKPANIFLVNLSGQEPPLEQFSVKLGDFGLARAARIPIPPLTRDIATLWYRAPEILLGSTSYSASVDIWSIGCIMSEMIRTTPLFFGECELETLLQIFKVLGTPQAETLECLTSLEYFIKDFPKWTVDPFVSLSNTCRGLDEQGVELLVKLLSLEPNDRITAREAILHPWFDTLTKSDYTFWNDNVPDWALQKSVKRLRPQKAKPPARKSLRIIQKLTNDPDVKRVQTKVKKKSVPVL